MRVKTLMFSLLMASLGHSVQAKETPTPAGLDYCTVCHGSQLMGNVNIGAPRLTDLSSWYVERQLQNFKLGKRGSHPADKTGGEMMLMVGKLSDEQISEIANWVTKTVSIKPKPMIAGDIHLGEKQYQTCAACHGATAEKAALGKSHVIKGWPAEKIEAALKGYKDGSYGGAMKGVMKGQVARLSDADIKDLAAQISKF